MITDPIFYRSLRDQPGDILSCAGNVARVGQADGGASPLRALEFKETAHRTDGIFRPTSPGLPLYFLEVQFYPLPSVFADLLVKAYTFLKQHDPGQEFCGVVLFASRPGAQGNAALRTSLRGWARSPLLPG